MRSAILAGALLTGAVALAEKPAVWWASYPVKPGEHILVSGGAWGAKPTVEIGGRTVRPDTVSETGLVFEYPKGLPASVRDFRIVAESGEKSDPVAFNVPTAWFMQGDDLDRSTPGGELRIFGRSLRVTALALRDAQGRQASLPLALTDDWSLRANVPKDVPCGDYAVVADGVEVGRWTVAPKREVCGKAVYDVTAFGAKPNDGGDDQAAILRAFRAAETNGGGVVFFPRGRFDVHGTLSVPSNTVLKGVSRDVSGIYWPDFHNPPKTLVELRTRTGLEDLFLSSGLFAKGISTPSVPGQWFAPPSEDVSLKRLVIRFSTNFWRDDRGAHDLLRRYNTPGDTILMANVRRLTIEDVDLYSDKNAIYGCHFRIGGEYVRIARSSFSGSGWTALNLKKAVVEDNVFRQSCQSILPGTREMFWSGNRHYERYTGDRENITHDLKSNPYLGELLPGTMNGRVLSLKVPEGTKYVFPGWVPAPWGKMEQWVGKQMEIVSGKGRGQSRDIVKVLSRDVYELDRPFDVQPDETSRFSVGESRVHIAYVDNELYDSKVAVFLYGGAHDNVVARNRAQRAGSFSVLGTSSPKGVCVSWDVQFVGNRLIGNMRPAHEGLSWDVVGSIGKAWDRYFDTHAVVIRDNEIDQGSVGLGAIDMLAENNTVRHAPAGICEFGYGETHFIGANVFEDVGKEIGGAADRVRLDRAPQNHSLTPWRAALAKGDEPPAADAALDWRSVPAGFGGFVYLDAFGEALKTHGVLLRAEAEVLKGPEAVIRLEAPLSGVWLRVDGKVVRDPPADRRPAPAFVLAPGRHVFEMFVPCGRAGVAARQEVRLVTVSEPETYKFVGEPNPKR